MCSWERHLTLTVLFSIQVHKWVPANFNMLVSNSAMDKHSIKIRKFKVLSRRKSMAMTKFAHVN